MKLLFKILEWWDGSVSWTEHHEDKTVTYTRLLGADKDSHFLLVDVKHKIKGGE